MSHDSDILHMCIKFVRNHREIEVLYEHLIVAEFELVDHLKSVEQAEIIVVDCDDDDMQEGGNVAKEN